MKYVCVILGLMLINNISAQVYKNYDIPFRDSVSNGVFTESENEFLNTVFSISEKIDFNMKKVCFLFGNGVPYVVISKECFFHQYKGMGQLYVFDEKQKKEADGYDIAISVFTKKMPQLEDMPKYVKKARKRKSKCK